MIENDHQLSETYKWLHTFREELEREEDHYEHHPSALNKIYVDAIRSMLETLEEEIFEYEQKHSRE